jgi:hypothetical protein
MELIRMAKSEILAAIDGLKRQYNRLMRSHKSPLTINPAKDSAFVVAAASAIERLAGRGSVHRTHAERILQDPISDYARAQQLHGVLSTLRADIKAGRLTDTESTRKTVSEPVKASGDATDVFVSWSGTASAEVAEVLSEWLPVVLPGTKPWMSKLDITKGKPWFQEISDQLARCRVCIICVTPTNVKSTWLYYEAGAIAREQDHAHICTYLIGLDPSGLAATPLAQYQATSADEADTWRLIKAINKALGAPHNEQVLRGHFKANWSALADKLTNIHISMNQEKPTQDNQDLSPEARRVLMEAAKDDRGVVAMGKTMHGFDLIVNKTKMCDPNDARVEATYRAAVKELVDQRLLDPQGSGGTSFVLTKPGYDLADKLSRMRASQPPTASSPDYNDNDVLGLLQGWMGGRTSEQNLAAIKFADVDNELNLPSGSAKRLLEQAAKEYAYVAKTKGENVITFTRADGERYVSSNSGWNDPNNPYRVRR